MTIAALAIIPVAVAGAWLAYRKPGAALVASIPAAIALSSVFAVMDEVLAASLSYLVIIITLGAIVLFRGAPDRDQWPQTTANPHYS